MQSKQHVKKTIAVFSVASFLNDLGSDIISPVWPLFVTTILGGSMTVLGLLDGLGEAVVSISQAVSGYISDRIRKRKIFIWLGYFSAGLSRIGYAISQVWYHVIPFRIMDRAGKMRGAPRDAIIADISHDSDRGKNFGILRTMDNLGALCGITISILFFSIMDYKGLFMLAAIPSLIGAVLIYSFIKDRPSSSAPYLIRERFNFRVLDKNFKLFLMLSCIFAVGSFTYSFLLILAKSVGFQTAVVPFLYLLLTAIASAFSLPFGVLSDRIGRRGVMFIALGFWIALCISVIFWGGLYGVFAALVLFGLHNAALDVAQKTFVAELAPAHFRATGLGGFQMMVGLCALPGSLIAGILWDVIDARAPFIFSLILTIIAAALLFFVRKDTI